MNAGVSGVQWSNNKALGEVVLHSESLPNNSLKPTRACGAPSKGQAPRKLLSDLWKVSGKVGAGGLARTVIPPQKPTKVRETVAEREGGAAQDPFCSCL